MWGVCGSQGGQVRRQVRSRQLCGVYVDHREDRIREGVVNDVGSVWITGSEDRSGVGGDVGSVWITGRTDQE